MNDYYRTILNDNIKKGLLDAISASKIKHPFLTGRLREIVVHQLLEPMLNNNFSMGTGKIIDYNGSISNEIDICIYSQNLLPPIFFSQNDNLAIFPFESVLSCIEVKSSFSKKNIDDAYKKFSGLERDLILTTGVHDSDNNPHPQIVVKPHYRLFIFQADMKNYSPESFLITYKKIDPKWNSAPVISQVCIAGKGSFCFTDQGWIHMAYDESNNIHEEVISFLATIVQDLPRTEYSRGVPRIGYYLVDAYTTDRIIDGKLHIRPWRPGKLIFKLQELQ
ncbi:DUF6602 domain-containing protein [Mucilaginibacter sp. L196]|uniref:DUF6602 domain-containing protein n=1 Tax=Mucilaginibacter sp. L196 TaxID=1641870 RepID=UPI00131AC083|nr:DUF6602 domain-containing protein [Mucilaginibacter sp. L196]